MISTTQAAGAIPRARARRRPALRRQWAGLALSFIRLVAAHTQRGDLREAIRIGEEGIALCDAHGEGLHRAYLQTMLGIALWRQGDTRRASALARDSLSFHRSLGNPRGIAINLSLLAWIATTEGRYEKAGRLLGRVGNSGNAAATATNLYFAISWKTGPAFWWVRRGMVKPWDYLDAWRSGNRTYSPREETLALRAELGETPPCTVQCAAVRQIPQVQASKTPRPRNDRTDRDDRDETVITLAPIAPSD